MELVSIQAVLSRARHVGRGGQARHRVSYGVLDEDGWIVARVLQVPGAISQGRTREEARENVIDALRLMLAPDDGDARAEAGRSEPLGLTLTE